MMSGVASNVATRIGDMTEGIEDPNLQQLVVTFRDLIPKRAPKPKVLGRFLVVDLVVPESFLPLAGEFVS